MSLEGSVETVSLAHVLRGLAANDETGQLLVVGRWMEGRLWLRSGRLVGARVGRTRAFVDAVFELLVLADGWMAFDPTVDLDRPGDPTDVASVVAEAEDRLGEWEAITATIPTLDTMVTLPERVADAVVLRPDQWRLVAAVGTGTTVRRLLEHLDATDFAVRRALRELADTGVIDVAEPPVRFERPAIAAPQAVVACPIQGLTRLAAPVAPVPAVAAAAS